MGRQAVQHNGVLMGLSQQVSVDLVGLKNRHSSIGQVFLAHAGPDVGVKDVAACDGGLGVCSDNDLAIAQLFCGFDHRWIRGIVCGRGNAHVHARHRTANHQRMGNVIAVPQVGHRQPSQLIKVLLHRLQVCQNLTGMLQIRQRVDDGDAGVAGNFF